MDDNALFGGTLDLAAKSLDLRSRRHEMVVSNLANADTPGYKAFDLVVEDSIRRHDNPVGRLQLAGTQPGHMPSAKIAAEGVRPNIIQLPEQDNLRGDGNTVDMDREMATLASNQLLYRASAQIVAKKFQGLKTVITGGK